MLQPKTELLSTKKHFETLDGLRGIAAIAVVVFHFMEIIEPDFEQNLFAHGYLAVDFFFCLSGFVIAYAYDQRMAEIGLLLFIKRRLIRLHPLVMIGAVIGALGFWLDPFSNLQQVYGGLQTFLLFLSSGLLIPYPIVTERYNNLFHLNAPSWSLFFEYVVNLLYALVLFRITKGLLYGVLLMAAGLLFYAAYTWGHLSVGWSSDNWWGGAVRVLYSFVAGMLIFRNQWILRSRIGFGWAVVLLIASFMVPFTNAGTPVVDPLSSILFSFSDCPGGRD